jgi:hypothetical protein
MQSASTEVNTMQVLTHRHRRPSRSGGPWALAILGTALLLGALAHRPARTAHRPLSPGVGARETAPLSSPDGPIPPAIQTTIHRGILAVTLRMAPLDVGPVHVVVSLTRGGRRVTDARVRLILSMPAQPAFGPTVLRDAPCRAGYCGQGTLGALGRWHVEVLVQVPSRPRGPGTTLRLPFDVLNGANARFLVARPPDTRFGPATVHLTRAGDGSYLLQVRLRPHLTVRAVLDMPNMSSMGRAVYAATALAEGWYGVPVAFPMPGVTQVVLEVRAMARWLPVRILLYDSGSGGRATLLTGTGQ